MSHEPRRTPTAPGAADAADGRARTPFASVRADVVVAVVLAATALAWATIDPLPGDRWMPVHLFTLGVMTPLIVAFSQHQLTSLWQVPLAGAGLRRSLLVAGIIGVSAGMVDLEATWSRPALATGSVAVTVAVALGLARLASALRREPRDRRFRWMVASYARAHATFLVGAALGALLGLQMIPGTWYVAIRHAHLHALLLGFATVTLLATVVLFGPMLLRAQIQPGAEASAERWLRAGSIGVLVAVVGLVGHPLPGPAATGLRLAAAAGVLVLAAAAVAILRPLAATVRRKGRNAPLVGVLLVCAIGWLVVALVGDAAVIATGRWRHLDVVGGIGLIGAFAQAITATVLHVATMWLPRQRRLKVYPRLDAIPLWVAALPQTGVVALILLWW